MSSSLWNHNSSRLSHNKGNFIVTHVLYHGPCVFHESIVLLTNTVVGQSRLVDVLTQRIKVVTGFPDM